jgi:hypothetical protein
MPVPYRFYKSTILPGAEKDKRLPRGARYIAAEAEATPAPFSGRPYSTAPIRRTDARRSGASQLGGLALSCRLSPIEG